MKKSIVYILLMTFGLSVLSANVIPDKPYYDFFRKLIEKKQKKKRKKVVRKTIKKQTKKVIPPLQIEILGISGEEGARIAIIKFNNQQKLIEEGDEWKPHYKVIRIDEEKVTFLHIQAGKRQEVNFQ